MDLLKQYLSEAIDLANGRRIAIFGFGAFGAVTCCALETLGVEPYCFFDVDRGRIGGEYFGKHVRGLWEYPDDASFVIDVFNDPAVMKRFAKENDLSEGTDYSSLHGIFGYKKCSMIDPLLVYNRTDDFPGFTVFDGRVTAKDDPIKIVTLGGSTSDSTFGGIKSWPELMHDILLEKNISNIVYNGGLVGYTSAQERDKFLRDVIPLKPDIVLSLSGDNDIGWAHCDPDNNYYSSYLKDQLVEPVYKRCMEENETFEYGLNREMSCADRWFKNHTVIGTTAREFGIIYRCFFQPCILSVGYNMSSFEKKWSDLLQRYGLTEHNTVKCLFENYDDFYNEVKPLMDNSGFFRDITDAFNSDPGIFIDGIHCCEEGNRILAEKFAGEVILMAGVKNG